MPDFKKKLLMPPKTTFFSVQEAAIILDVPVQTVNSWIQSGILPAYTIGVKNPIKKIFFQDLNSFIESHMKQNHSERQSS